jgi:hypothetical protein
MAALGGTVEEHPNARGGASWGNPPLVDGFKAAPDSSVTGGSGTPSGRSSIVPLLSGSAVAPLELITTLAGASAQSAGDIPLVGNRMLFNRCLYFHFHYLP